MQLKALLLDLDGTLIDTAPDMVAALNHVLTSHKRTPVDLKQASKLVSKGAYALLQYGFDNTLDEKQLTTLRQEFLDYYESNISTHSKPYTNMQEVLSFCEQNQLYWGIVTNKPYYLAEKLLTELNLFNRSAITLGGDSLAKSKPHPMPLLHCCMKLSLAASECLYVGDDERDIIAGKAAGMDTAVANWGYINDQTTENWQADYLLTTPNSLLTLLKEQLQSK